MSWCRNLKQWGYRPHELAKRLDCPVRIVVEAYHGDEAAFYKLLDGSASKTGKKIMHPDLSGPFEFISADRRKRPPWMTRDTHERLMKELR